VHRYGVEGDRPKTYIQASIHADELPGMLTAHHLLRRLDDLAAQGRLRGDITLVPYANPIGLDQVVLGDHLGRYTLDGAVNFNRNYPDVTETVADRVAGRLGGDADENVRLVRAEFAGALAEVRPSDHNVAMKLELMKLAADADIVLDLHCDSNARMHVYLHADKWPEGRDLAAFMGSDATLLAETSGGNPFDESFSLVWDVVARRHPDIPVPMPVLASTVELRGETDVTDELADQDAENLIGFLHGRGHLDGEPPAPPPLRRDATDLSAVDVLFCPAAGVIVWKCAVGDIVEDGQLVAEVVDPTADDPADARTPIHARTTGLLFARTLHPLGRAGAPIAKIAGEKPLEWRKEGALMQD